MGLSMSGAPAAQLAVVAEYATRDDERVTALRQPTLILIDQRSLTRDSLGSWLAGILDGFTVKVAAGVEGALAHVDARSQISLVLCHIGGERVTSPQVAELMARLAAEMPGVPVAVLADAEDIEAVLAALRAGLRGYIPTNLNAAVAVEVVKLICAGETFAPVASFLREAPPAAAKEQQLVAPPVLGGFSARQLQIIQCLRRGVANKAIAYELSMSQGTVKVHIRNIMKKLGAQNRTQIVIMTSGLVIDQPSR